MCVIIICPAGRELPQGILNTAMERNPHGWGMSAKNDDGSFTVQKGWKEPEAWDEWNKLGDHRERIFHARVATHGGVNLENLHPFDASFGAYGADGVAGTDAESRLFYHNGTVDGLPLLNEKRSDSWHVATYLQAFPTTKKFVDHIAEFARREQSRFVLCTRKQTWYFGSGWITRDGIIYSNGSALGGVEHKRRVWAGGLIHKEGTVTKNPYDGFIWDNKLKAYIPDPSFKVPEDPWNKPGAKPAESPSNVTYTWNGKTYSTLDENWWREGAAHDNRDTTPTKAEKKVSYAVTPGFVEGKPHRYADDQGFWWEYDKARKTRTVVEGPHPDSVVYGACDAQGVGAVYMRTKTKGLKVIGRYKYDRLTPYIKTHFGVAQYEPLTESKKLHAFTDEEWAAMEREG